MRILHIITSLDPQFGGTSEAVRVMLRYAPEGCPSEVVTVDQPDAPFLRNIEAPVHALGPARSAYAYSPRLVAWLRANLSRYDGVILHGLWQHVSLATLRVVAGHLPYFVFPHGMLDPYFRRAFPLKHLKKLPVWFAVDYWVLRRAARVLFTSQAEASLATESFALHRWTPTVVPFGSMPPEGDAAAQRDIFFTRHSALRGRRILLFLGRIHPKKGCDLLVDSFARVAAKDRSLDLVLAGPDPQNWRPALEQPLRAAGLAHRVHFPGMLTGDAKWGAFYAAEAFILPSHQENFGIAVSEALSCGTPVLLSDKVNIAPEIAQDGAGYMEPDTAEGTLRLLTRWLDTPQAEREALSACALDTFARRYDMREGAKTIPRLFEAVIHRTASPAIVRPMPRDPHYNAADHIPAETAADPYLRPAFSARDRARRLLWNVCRALLYRPSPRPLHAWRAFLLRSFGATLGPGCHFYPASRVWAPWNLICEDQVTAADGAEIYNPAPVHLGSHAILSQDAYLCGATHDYDDAAFPLLAYEMRLGAYSWICARASVAPGTSVGEGAVLGLGSVATRDLEPWSVYAGVPAQKVKPRRRPAGR